MNSSFSIPAVGTIPVFELYARISLGIIVQLWSLPLNIYVLWLIVRNAKHGIASEFFAINLCVCEFIICGNVVLLLLNISVFENDPNPLLTIFTSIISFYHSISRPCFQCCVCVELYVAVIHPVIFLKYKPIRYRIACSVVIWIIVLGFSVYCNYLNVRNAMYYILLPEYILVFSIKFVCSIAVLKALRKPGPGEKLSAKDVESNRIKKKAFWVIVIILTYVFITYLPMIMFVLVYGYLSEAQAATCVVVLSYFVIFAGFFHPFLYLHRVGKLNFISGLRFCSNGQD